MTGYAERGASPEDVRKALERFAGWENLEERIVERPQIDRYLLAALRAAARMRH